MSKKRQKKPELVSLSDTFYAAYRQEDEVVATVREEVTSLLKGEVKVGLISLGSGEDLNQ